jgi:hypothetical protein
MKASKKSKKNNPYQEQIPADFLMLSIQLYSSIVKNAVQKQPRTKLDSKTESLLDETMKQLQDRQPDIDVHWLFHSLHRLMAWKTFDNITMGQTIVQELNELNIEVPVLVENCLQEIEMRTRIVKEYANVKHQWSEQEIQDWKNEIESKLLTYSYDINSRRQYLAGAFSDAVSEIKRLESEAVSKYGYYIESFYNADTFVATELELNDLFFHGEMFAGGYSAFHNIFLLLKKYIDKHNEVALIKSLINNLKQFEKQNIPYTHREIMIAHHYKWKAGFEKLKTANDWKKERGNACYNDYYSLQPGTKNKKNPYKKATAKELNKVLELLEDYPQLQEQVKHDLARL